MSNEQDKIDYESEVKKVYPTAYCTTRIHRYVSYEYIIVVPKCFLFIKWRKIIGVDTIYAIWAWRKAYEQLNQQKQNV